MPETIAYYTPQPDGTYKVELLPESLPHLLELGNVLELEDNGPPDEDGRRPMRLKVAE